MRKIETIATDLHGLGCYVDIKTEEKSGKVDRIDIIRYHDYSPPYTDSSVKYPDVEHDNHFVHIGRYNRGVIFSAGMIIMCEILAYEIDNYSENDIKMLDLGLEMYEVVMEKNRGQCKDLLV